MRGKSTASVQACQQQVSQPDQSSTLATPAEDITAAAAWSIGGGVALEECCGNLPRICKELHHILSRTQTQPKRQITAVILSPDQAESMLHVGQTSASVRQGAAPLAKGCTDHLLGSPGTNLQAPNHVCSDAVIASLHLYPRQPWHAK